MNQTLVITLISDDKPGIVDTLAGLISEHGGSWRESRMSHLAGKFAGIVQVSLPQENSESLQAALAEQADMKIAVDVAKLDDSDGDAQTMVSFTAIGSDRPGIVKEIAQALASHHINLYELHTDYTSAPHTGEALFQTQADIAIPDNVDMENLAEQLDEIAEQLAIDIDLES